MAIDVLGDDRRYLEAAWEVVQLELFMGRGQLQEIKNFYFSGDYPSGNCQQIAKYFEPLFKKSWGWNNLDQNIYKFREHGKMPTMLHWASAEFDIPLPSEVGTAGIIDWFTVAELKDYCGKQGLSKQGKRADIEARIIEDGRFCDVWSSVIEKIYWEKASRKEELDRKNRIEVLLHYIEMTAYKLKNIPDLKRNHYWRPYAFLSGLDEVEEWYALSFDAITETDFPPFFPGDRTTIISLTGDLAQDARDKGKKVIPILL